MEFGIMHFTHSTRTRPHLVSLENTLLCYPLLSLTAGGRASVPVRRILEGIQQLVIHIALTAVAPHRQVTQASTQLSRLNGNFNRGQFGDGCQQLSNTAPN